MAICPFVNGNIARVVSKRAWHEGMDPAQALSSALAESRRGSDSRRGRPRRTADSPNGAAHGIRHRACVPWPRWNPRKQRRNQRWNTGERESGLAGEGFCAISMRQTLPWIPIALRQFFGPHRLARPRTSALQAENAGSNPAGDTKKFKGLRKRPLSCFSGHIPSRHHVRRAHKFLHRI